MRTRNVVLLSLTLLAGTCLGQTGNLTGKWKLDVEKSTWGSLNKPHSVFLEIKHQDPALEYWGTVTYSNEDSREFGFHGSIDGKDYPMTRSYGNGTIRIERVDRNTLRSSFRSEDGMYVENARTILSADGRQLRRELDVRSPEGKRRWVEIYVRQ